MQLVGAAGWERMPSLPEGSGNFVCGTVQGDLVLVGGITWKNDIKQWRNTIWRFDSHAAKWTQSGTLPGPIAYAAFGQASEGIYFSGGSDGQGTCDTLRLLDAKFEVRTVARFPCPLCYSGHALGRGRLFVIGGGTDANDLNTLTNLAYSLDVRTGETNFLPAYPGGSLLLPAAAMAGTRVCVFGGAAWDAGNNHAVNTDAAFAWSIGAKEWKGIKPYPFPVRGLAACPLDDRHILLGGGYGQAFTDFAAIYDTKRDQYRETRRLPVPATADFIKAGEFIYWVGGEHAMRQRSDAVHRIRWKDLL